MANKNHVPLPNKPAEERLQRIFGHLVTPAALKIASCSAQANIIRSPFPDIVIPDISVFQLFLDSCFAYPQNLAVVNAESGQTYTYEQLLSCVKKFGSALVRRGFRKGDILAICVPNCPEYVIPFFATIGIGGIVTTINPVYTANEIYYQLQDSHPKWIVTAPEVLESVSQAVDKNMGHEVIIVIGEEVTKKHLSFYNLLEDDGRAFPEHVPVNVHKDVAILPYSSGTTGKPKGVMLTHYNLVANVHQTRVCWPVVQENRYICFLPMFHLYGIFLTLLALSHGACIYYLSKFEPRLFLHALEKYKITHAHLVPPVVNFLVKSPLTMTYGLSNLKKAYCGAAPLGKETSEELLRKIPSLQLLQQGFGMTETSPAITGCPETEMIPSTVGYVVPNSEVKVIDLQTGKALGPNEEGEICVRGPQVMKGYLNNPKATNETIHPDGFLHTGDTGYYTDKGLFYIVDRVKELIKYNAYQVAPAELEALLMSHPGIEDAAVIGIPNERTGEVPKAFVVKKDRKLIEQQIKVFVKKNVAHFKQLRGGIQFVDEIPKSGCGKILRRILREREAQIHSKY